MVVSYLYFVDYKILVSISCSPSKNVFDIGKKKLLSNVFNVTL